MGLDGFSDSGSDSGGSSEVTEVSTSTSEVSDAPVDNSDLETMDDDPIDMEVSEDSGDVSELDTDLDSDEDLENSAQDQDLSSIDDDAMEYSGDIDSGGVEDAVSADDVDMDTDLESMDSDMDLESMDEYSMADVGTVEDNVDSEDVDLDGIEGVGDLDDAEDVNGDSVEDIEDIEDLGDAEDDDSVEDIEDTLDADDAVNDDPDNVDEEVDTDLESIDEDPMEDLGEVEDSADTEGVDVDAENPDDVDDAETADEAPEDVDESVDETETTDEAPEDVDESVDDAETTDEAPEDVDESVDDAETADEAPEDVDESVDDAETTDEAPEDVDESVDDAETADEAPEDVDESVDDAETTEDTTEVPETENKDDTHEIDPAFQETLNEFQQEHWETLSPEEQRTEIENLRDHVANDLDLQNKPDIQWYNNKEPGDYGGYSREQNTIYINSYNMWDARETADTVAHESRHCWQRERAENPQNEQDLAFKENYKDYISPYDDYQAYREQPVEQDARAYAADICDHIGAGQDAGNGSDSPVENTADVNMTDVSEIESEVLDIDEEPPAEIEVLDMDKEPPAEIEVLDMDEEPQSGIEVLDLKLENKFDNNIAAENNDVKDLPHDLESKYEIKPLTDAAIKKCEAAGLDAQQVQEIREIPHGSKPDPETYLESDYIEDHLATFKENGCYKILSDKRGEPQGTIGTNGEVFVMSGEDVNRLISDANGDPRALEEALGMSPGYLGDNPYLVRCDEPHNLRMPTGNEGNAFQEDWCPAGTTRGGYNEAVIDALESGEYSYKHVFGDGPWQ